MKISELARQEYDRYEVLFSHKEEIKGKSFLITGSKGIVGTAVIQFLLFLNEKDHLGIRIFASTRSPEKKPDYYEEKDDLTFVKFGEEAQDVGNQKIDFIISGASPTNSKAFKEHPIDVLRINIDSLERFLDYGDAHSVQSIVFLSSIEVYGDNDTKELIPETKIAAFDPLYWRNCYPIAKKACEALCYAYFSEHHLPVKIARLGLVQGLTQEYDVPRVYSSILSCICEKKDLVFYSKGETMRTMVYTLDAVTGILTILLKGQSGEAYNVANPEMTMTVADMCKHLFEVFDPQNKVVFNIDEAKCSTFQKPTYVNMSTQKLETLGWKPMTGLDLLYKIDIKRFTEK